MASSPRGNPRFSVSTFGDHELDSVGRQSRRVSALTSPDHPQFAEFDPHLGPQVFQPIPEAPEPVVLPRTPTPQLTPDGFAHDALPRDTFDSLLPSAPCPPPLSRFQRLRRWAAKKPYLAAAAVFGIIGLVCLIALPIALRGLSLSGDASHLPSISPAPASTSMTTPSSITTSSPTSTSFSPSGVPAPRDCDPKNRVGHVNFLGISDPDSKSWDFQLLPASDPTNCCAQCYKAFPRGCQGWAFLPWDGTRTPCNVVFNFPGSDPDKTCPKGHAFVVLGTSASDPKFKDSFGGAGPCGTTAGTTGG